MRRLLDIADTGLVAIRLHPLRSLATVACLVAVLVPYIACLALAQGLQADAEDSIHFGADLYVSGSQFGRAAAVPVAALAAIRGIEGVENVTPRVVGSIVLGRSQEQVVVVGLPTAHFPATVECINGRLPAEGNVHEVVIGTELARRLGLGVGSVLPPFYRNNAGEKLTTVVGIFRADLPLWQANIALTTLDSAAAIFNQQALATDVLVDCKPGYADTVRSAILRQVTFGPPGAATSVRPRVTTRADLESLLPAGLLHRQGVFNILWLLALTVSILVVAVTSEFGVSARRREIGILKATGWQTDEILFRSVVESLSLSLLGAAIAAVLAWLWLAWLNGYGIAGVFLSGVGAAPSFAIPYRFTPVPALLAVVMALAIMLTGTLYSSWRAATASPREAMR